MSITVIAAIKISVFIAAFFTDSKRNLALQITQIRMRES
jgi:hypothetical protein